jgi:3-hydroxybutyryl-CoA dehydratase
MKTTLTFEDVEVGQGFKPAKELITQESINTYGDAAGDLNPVHVDPEWAAKNSPFKGTIAHGMTSLAFISRLVNANFGKAWLFGGSMDVSFKQPVKPGDTISAKAKVIGKRIEEGNKVLELSVFCENQNRDAVITGKATITFSSDV